MVGLCRDQHSCQFWTKINYQKLSVSLLLRIIHQLPYTSSQACHSQKQEPLLPKTATHQKPIFPRVCLTISSYTVTWYFLLFSISSFRFASHSRISFSTFFSKASKSWNYKMKMRQDNLYISSIRNLYISNNFYYTTLCMSYLCQNSMTRVKTYHKIIYNIQNDEYWNLNIRGSVLWLHL